MKAMSISWDKAVVLPLAAIGWLGRKFDTLGWLMIYGCAGRSRRGRRSRSHRVHHFCKRMSKVAEAHIHALGRRDNGDRLICSVDLVFTLRPQLILESITADGSMRYSVSQALRGYSQRHRSLSLITPRTISTEARRAAVQVRPIVGLI